MRKLTIINFAFVCLTASCFVLFPGDAFTDTHFGGQAGLSISKWHRDTTSSIKRANKPGPLVGTNLQLRHWHPFVAQFELSFISRGTEGIDTTAMEPVSLGVFNLRYLDAAILGRAELPLGPVTLYGLLGPRVSLLITATVSEDDGTNSNVRDDFKTFDIGAVAGAGLAVGPFSWGTLSLDVRYDMAFTTVDENGVFSNRTIATTLGYSYRRNDDPDGDGIRGKADRCPKAAEDRDDFEDADGCPDKDNDEDDIADDKDKCPDEKGVAPDGCPARDTDEDGVLGADDKCPDHAEPESDKTRDGCPDKDDDGVWDHDEQADCIEKPEDKDGYQDEDGCPDADNDSDGILDAADQCPDKPEDKDKFQDDDGCPDDDNDGDGIPDASDGKDGACKNQPETKNGWQDDDGCKDRMPKPVSRLIGVLKLRGFAADGKLDITKSARVQKKLAKTLKKYPAFKLLILGYSADQQISDDNASALAKALGDLDIASDRITTRGCVIAEDAPRKAKAVRIELAVVGDTSRPEDFCKVAPSQQKPQ